MWIFKALFRALFKGEGISEDNLRVSKALNNESDGKNIEPKEVE
jgi:hypothetical protein